MTCYPYVNNVYRSSDPFSELSKTTEGRDRHLRAVIQDLSHEFAEEMATSGQKWKIVDAQSTDSCSHGEGHQNVEMISRNEFIEKIEMLSRSTREQGLGSAVNNYIIGIFFRIQSTKWPRIAQEHIESVLDAVKSFLEQSFASLADGRILNAILLDVVDPVMEEMTVQAKKKLIEVLTPYTKLQPISYNREFIRVMKETRAKGHFGSSEILDCMNAYYEVSRVTKITQNEVSNGTDMIQTSLGTFVDNVATLVVENCVLVSLTGVFPAAKIPLMDDVALDRLSSESQEDQSKRRRLESKLRCLNKNLDICKKTLDLRPAWLVYILL